jgi:tetratricopeptide (TPR) repeat protein
MGKMSAARTSGLLAVIILGASLASGQSAPVRPASSSATDSRQRAIRGIDLMMDGDLSAAIEVFQEIQRRDPESPLGYVLEANVTWWRVYYASANLIDPDVFDVSNPAPTPYDSHFTDLIDISIRKAELRIHAREDLARSYLYEGYAYALRARLEGLRGRDLPTARAGKKMRALMLRTLALDPSLTDAYLGVGIYNYFVDTLPGIVKVLSLLIGLPGGSRQEGLRQLQLCVDQGEMARAESKFYLAKDYSRASERNFEESLRLFRELGQEYPHNPLWPMLMGSLQFRLGKPQQGKSIYREVYQNTSGKTAEVDVAVHKAADKALKQLHPE